MADFMFYRSFPTAMLSEKHNINGGDTLKALLISSAPDPNDDVWADLSGDELSTGGGYTSGGVTVTASLVVVDGITRVIVSSPDWTGVSGGFSFRAMVLKNHSAPSGEMVGYLDMGRTITIAATESTKTLGYTELDQTAGLLVFGGSVE